MSDALGALGSDFIVTFGIAVLFTLAAIVVGRFMYGRRIRRWAKSRKLTLVDWRPAWFYEGPDAFLRSRYRNVFWIEVEDRDGIASTGWLVYSWWPFDTDPEIEWN